LEKLDRRIRARDGFAAHDAGGYFDSSALDMAMDVRRDATFALQQMGLDIEISHHEVARATSSLKMF